MEDELRAVVEAARAWAATISVFETEEAENELGRAVERLEDVLRKEEPNKPGGFVLTRPWELVPSGWFVKAPNGIWYEVVDTCLFGEMQLVTLRGPDGKTVQSSRVPTGEVKVRRGTQTTKLDDAIEALSDVFGGTAILQDGTDS